MRDFLRVEHVEAQPAFAAVGATPAQLLACTTPVSNDAVSLSFKQAIAVNDPLRTGTYGKALTFTLSSSNP